jgi:hypothetical protein
LDFFNFAKAVEQGVYDVMMWIFFYPYTLLRTLLFPGPMLQYVYVEARKEPDIAFADAMRPALLIFISIIIGTLVAPLTELQKDVLRATHFGRLVVDSWFLLVLYRMVAFSFFPLAGALLLDLLTPGAVSRLTLRSPFYQQCYVCAPFALIASPMLVNIQHDSWIVFVAFAAVSAWFLVAQFIFFRTYARQSVPRALVLSPLVLVLGTAGMTILGVLAAS